VRTWIRVLPVASPLMRQATTVFLCTSKPAQRE
jgi:hypothetical protein